MKYLKLFKDNDDYVKEFTKDNIINIIGLKGSGKTTNSLKYLDNKDYLVINTDRLFDINHIVDANEIDDLKEYILKKHKEIIPDSDFYKYYESIVEYSNKHKRNLIIEGNALLDMDLTKMKGTLIIKRTAIVKCYKRAVRRDYKIKYFMDKEKEKHKHLYKVTRFINISKRRKKIFKESKNIEKIIEDLEDKK